MAQVGRESCDTRAYCDSGDGVVQLHAADDGDHLGDLETQGLLDVSTDDGDVASALTHLRTDVGVTQRTSESDQRELAVLRQATSHARDERGQPHVVEGERAVVVEGERAVVVEGEGAVVLLRQAVLRQAVLGPVVRLGALGGTATVLEGVASGGSQLQKLGLAGTLRDGDTEHGQRALQLGDGHALEVTGAVALGLGAAGATGLAATADALELAATTEETAHAVALLADSLDAGGTDATAALVADVRALTTALGAVDHAVTALVGSALALGLELADLGGPVGLELADVAALAGEEGDGVQTTTGDTPALQGDAASGTDALGHALAGVVHRETVGAGASEALVDDDGLSLQASQLGQVGGVEGVVQVPVLAASLAVGSAHIVPRGGALLGAGALVLPVLVTPLRVCACVCHGVAPWVADEQSPLEGHVVSVLHEFHAGE